MEATATVVSSQRLIRILLRSKDEPFSLSLPDYQDEFVDVPGESFWVLHDSARPRANSVPVSGPFMLDDPRFVVHLPEGTT